MAENVTPGAQQKAQQLNLARNRRRPGTGGVGNVAKGIAGAAAAPQFAAADLALKKFAPNLRRSLGFDKKSIRMIWRVLLWILLPLVPIIIILFLLLVGIMYLDFIAGPYIQTEL